MITRRSVLVSSLLASLPAGMPRNRAPGSAAGGQCPFPIDVVHELIGPELLRTGDATFCAAARRFARRDAPDFDSLWADETWLAKLRADFADGRVVLVHGFVLSYSESVAYAAVSLRT